MVKNRRFLGSKKGSKMGHFWRGQKTSKSEILKFFRVFLFFKKKIIFFSKFYRKLIEIIDNYFEKVKKTVHVFARTRFLIGAIWTLKKMSQNSLYLKNAAPKLECSTRRNFENPFQLFLSEKNFFFSAKGGTPFWAQKMSFFRVRKRGQK